MTTIGYATLQVIPTITGVSAAMEKQLGGLDKIGRSAGKKLGDGLAAGVDAAAKQVEQATAKVVAARAKEADAAGKVRVAEAKLESLRAKGTTDAGRLAAAEERVAAAKRGLATATTAVARDLAAETSATNKLADARKRADAAGSGMGKVRSALAGIHQDAERATGSLGGIANKFTSLIGMTSLLALPGAALAKGFDRLASIDEAKAKLSALGQDAASVDLIMQNALASVDKTAFGLGDAAGVAGVIVGAGIKPGEELERTLKLVADTAAITGGSLGDIGSIFGKVAAQGKLDGEVMAQLLDRQIGILPKLAERYGVTADEAKKMVSDGKVSFADFQSVMDRLVGGGAQKMGKTFSATMANMNAALGRLGAAVLGPLFEKLPGLFDTLTGMIDSLTPQLKGIGDVLSQYSGWITPIAAGIGAVVTAMVAWKVATMAAAAAQAAFNVVLAANPIGLIILAIVGIGTALVVAYKKSETFRDIVNGVWNAVKAVIGAVVSWFTDTAWPAIKAAWDFIVNAFRAGKETIGIIIETIKSMWQGLMDKAGEVRDWVVDKFTGMVSFIKELPGRIRDAASGLWEGLKGGLVGVLNWIAGKWNAFADGLSFSIPGTDIEVSIPKMPTFATGGYTGNGGKGQVAGVVHGGEYVINADATKGIENAYPGLLDYLNNKGALPGYQSGGKVQLGNISGPGITTKEQQSMWDAVRGRFPDAVLTSATRTVMTEGHPDFHNAGRAIDISGPGMGAIASWIASTYPDSLELIHSPFGRNIKNGKNVGDGNSFYGSGLMAAHRDHVHWALGRSAGAATTDKPTQSTSESAEPRASVESDVAPSAGETYAPASTPSDSLSMTMPDSFSGLAGMFGGQLGDGVGATSGGSDLGMIGEAAGAAVSGQVGSALGVFGINDSPGWLKGLSQLVGGISISSKGGDGASSPIAPIASIPKVAAAAIDSVAPHAGTGQAPGPQVVYNIAARDTEDAFIRAQQQERERTAAKLARF